jgi:hypothetical protein
VELAIVNHDGPWTWSPHEGGEWEVELPEGGRVAARWRRERCSRADRTCAERATFRHVVDGRALEEATHLYTMRMWTYDDLRRLASASGFRIREAWRGDADSDRVRVEVTRDAENDGENRYYVLEPVTR